MPINTKQYIANIFFDMCKEKNMKNITIYEISQKCGLSRQTFYNHYSDKQEIVEYIWLSSFGDILYEFKKFDDWSIKSANEISKNWWFYNQAIHATNFWSWHENWLKESMKNYLLTTLGKDQLSKELIHSINLWVTGCCRFFMENIIDKTVDFDYIAILHNQNMPPNLRLYFKNND